jgi:xylulokinase
VLAPAEYVALGAARQAAWALTGSAPVWPRPEESSEQPPDDVERLSAGVRNAYAAVRDASG